MSSSPVCQSALPNYSTPSLNLKCLGCSNESSKYTFVRSHLCFPPSTHLPYLRFILTYRMRIAGAYRLDSTVSQPPTQPACCTCWQFKFKLWSYETSTNNKTAGLWRSVDGCDMRRIFCDLEQWVLSCLERGSGSLLWIKTRTLFFRGPSAVCTINFSLFEIPESRGIRTAHSPLQRRRLQQGLMMAPRCCFQERAITGMWWVCVIPIVWEQHLMECEFSAGQYSRFLASFVSSQSMPPNKEANFHSGIMEKKAQMWSVWVFIC